MSKYKIIYEDVYDKEHIKVLAIVENIEEAKIIQNEYIEKDADWEFQGIKCEDGSLILEGFVIIKELL